MLTAVSLWIGGVQAAEFTIRPVADGTIVDGGAFGARDGVPDAWDWTFNESGFEGGITLVTEPAHSALEQRVFWEFDLQAVADMAPVVATFTFSLRGPARFPADPADVHVYQTSADLLETVADFARAPAVLVGTETIDPYQPTTTYVISVSGAINQLLQAGVTRIGLRFQIDPNTPFAANQVFMDALDAEPTSKPFLTIRPAAPGDINADGTADLLDFAMIQGCQSGPGAAVEGGCESADLDGDGDVDMADVATFSRVFGGSGP